MKAPINNFTTYMRNNRSELTTKYPFLTQNQIVAKLRTQWKKFTSRKDKPGVSSNILKDNVQSKVPLESSGTYVESSPFPSEKLHACCESPVFDYEEIDSPFVKAKFAIERLNNQAKSYRDFNLPRNKSRNNKHNGSCSFKQTNGNDKHMSRLLSPRGSQGLETTCSPRGRKLKTCMKNTPNRREQKSKVSFWGHSARKNDCYEFDCTKGKDSAKPLKVKETKREQLKTSLKSNHLKAPLSYKSFKEKKHQQKNASPIPCGTKTVVTPTRFSKRLENTPVRSYKHLTKDNRFAVSNNCLKKQVKDTVAAKKNFPLRSTPAREIFQQILSNDGRASRGDKTGKDRYTKVTTKTIQSRMPRPIQNQVDTQDTKKEKFRSTYSQDNTDFSKSKKINCTPKIKRSSNDVPSEKSEYDFLHEDELIDSNKKDDDDMDGMNHCICSDDEDSSILLRREDPGVSAHEDSDQLVNTTTKSLIKTRITPRRTASMKVIKRNVKDDKIIEKSIGNQRTSNEIINKRSSYNMTATVKETSHYPLTPEILVDPSNPENTALSNMNYSQSESKGRKIKLAERENASLKLNKTHPPARTPNTRCVPRLNKAERIEKERMKTSREHIPDKDIKRKIAGDIIDELGMVSQVTEDDDDDYAVNVVKETNAALLNALMRLKAKVSSSESSHDEDSQTLCTQSTGVLSQLQTNQEKVCIGDMFEDPPIVPEKKTTPGDRRVVVSGTGTNSSNFGIMFEDQEDQDILNFC